MDQPWFKHWGKLSIASSDLNSLTDHEERVWWRLLAVGCSESDRWRIRVPHEALARMCASTPAKLAQVIRTLEQRDMAHVEADGALFLINAEKYQETPEARRKRAQRERDAAVTRHVTRHENVTPNVTVEERSRGEKRDPKVSIEPLGRRSRSALIPLSPEERSSLILKWAGKGIDVNGELSLACSHEARKKYPTNQLGYCDQWLRRAVEFKEEHDGRTSKTGRNSTRSADGVAESWLRVAAERDATPGRVGANPEGSTARP